MKKLLLNMVIGIIISIAVLGVTTLWLGTIYAYNGFTDLLIEELFSNIESKVLLVSLGGIIAGIFNYIGLKYKNKSVWINILPVFLLAILTYVIMSFTNYTILFEVMYFAVLGLAMCIAITIPEILSTKDVEKNKNVETKEN